MGIAKFDDGIPDNPKHIAAGPAACWLWFASVCYCRRALTDGFIPKQKVPALVVGLVSPWRHAARLVGVGLWDEALGGYQVHDYLEWNPSKLTVEDYRRRDKERKHRAFPDRIPDGIQTESERRGASHAGAKSKYESEKKSEGLDLSGDKSAREGAALVRVPQNHNPHAKDTNLINGGDLRRHGVHAWCHFERGLCVPYGLHTEFKARGLKSNEDMLAWYPTVVARYDGQPVGDDTFAFWRNEFAGWIGTVTAAPTSRRLTRNEESIAAARRILSEREAK